MPFLPGDEIVRGIEEIGESRRQLGNPIVEYRPQRVGDAVVRNVVWGFLQGVPDGKFRVLVVRIWFGEDGTAVKTWIGRGDIEEARPAGSSDPSNDPDDEVGDE